MTAFKITQTDSSVVLGVYAGDSEAEAIDAMARDAGYADADSMNAATGGSSDDLELSPLKASLEVHDVFREHEAGSDGFIMALDALGSSDTSRDEIKRIALFVKDVHDNDIDRAEAFVTTWQDEDWWLDSIGRCSGVMRREEHSDNANELARHVISGVVENFEVNGPMGSPTADWGADEAVAVYLDNGTIEHESGDGDTVEIVQTEISSAVMSAVTSRVSAWWLVPSVTA